MSREREIDKADVARAENARSAVGSSAEGKLLPCPLCGDALAWNKFGNAWMHPPNRCLIQGIAVWGEEKIAAWNTRPPDSARIELASVFEEVMAALRLHAPGTPLNNHSFDDLGIKAYAAIAKAARS